MLLGLNLARHTVFSLILIGNRRQVGGFCALRRWERGRLLPSLAFQDPAAVLGFGDFLRQMPLASLVISGCINAIFPYQVWVQFLNRDFGGWPAVENKLGFGKTNGSSGKFVPGMPIL